ncbi:unnamed protein product [marine sediment metagenome]|uniref:Uncharacterized protein n=1 Tax=marine sediment metagenome TaxID=412755 RepID=X1IK72_9ZZZZ
MPEPNEKTMPTPAKQEICTIRIMFPVTSDDDAIECKKRIQELLRGKPDVMTDFSIRDMPSKPVGM